MTLWVDRVSKTFPGSMKASICDVSFQVSEGEFVCVIGPSGSGKSTLINLIAGLETPSTGEITLDGKPVREPGADRVVMFQESALFPWLNVFDNVRFGLKNQKKTPEEQEKIATRFLKMVRLSEFAEYRVHQLSGGMKQRAALARALALDSKILLMDEPFASLDKQTINLLREELAVIWKETRKTIILVTHSVEEALFFADRIIMLSAEPATVREVMNIDLPRPRSIESEAFLSLRKDILKRLRVEVEEVAKGEHDAR
ncbi:MAG: ABC transporter ATP-binding protein [Clostridiaceae bacterium]|nr:ABC transporter ATP-binding protein [Clostridiaceae bacterium]